MPRFIICLSSLILGLLFCPFLKAAPSMICTTSLIEDWLRQIIGPEASIPTLIPQDADPHAFELSPQGRIQLEKADLIFAHGYGFEGHLLDTLQTLPAQKVVYLSRCRGIKHPSTRDKVPNTDCMFEEDPHIWMNPREVLPMLDQLCEQLCLYEPSQAAIYKKRAEQYKQDLEALDTELENLLSSIPPKRRYLICQHNNLSHFSKRYNFKVLATLHTHGEEPSANLYRSLLETIKSYDIPVIFYDPREEDRLVKTLAREARIQTQPLLVEALHEKAPTYKDLVSYTAKTLFSALKD